MHLLRHALPRPARGAELTSLPPPRLLAGLGRPDHGDDAAGPLVVARAAELLRGRAHGLRIVRCVEPAALLDLWTGVDLAVLVDAVLAAPSGDGAAAGDAARPGRLILLEAGSAVAGAPAAAWRRSRSAGTHTLGLAELIELGRALDRLPRRLILVGIEASAFGAGTGPSAAVAAAVEPAAQTVRRLLSGPPAR